MEHIIIDAKGLIIGRLATYAAKQALLGNKIDVVNCGEAIITGKRQEIIESYKQKVLRGNVFKGPFISRNPDRLVRRTIRGMLPYKNYRGKIAFKNVMCYNTVPFEFKDKEKLNFKKTMKGRYMTLSQISKLI